MSATHDEGKDDGPGADGRAYRESLRMRIRRGALARTGRDPDGDDPERREPDELFDPILPDAPPSEPINRD